MRAFFYTILLTLAICFTSCRSIKYVPVETVRIEYKTRDSIRFDSIYQRDSVFLLIKGDTVYKERYKYLYRYLTINNTDTVIKTDSIQIPYPVEKELSRWQKIKLELGGWAFGTALALLFIIIGNIVYNRKVKKGG
ncbi:hypothetical protein KGH27_14890 [Bacteroides faecis]|jgi:hypothetical protein|uniref:hypothetical protein n=1 Tax=Bacteroides faecis TaxID=674529 RepID=UPI001C8C3B0A|nr:hypothetical protein [Bacteroides faecis]MCC2068755.1 hypothetical protein [Bacteroides faecis]DAQ62157.1 MAG TPA: hypothetical protein [Caudoviricetes sp.]